jgi:Flp pilus assembly protein TadB
MSSRAPIRHGAPPSRGERGPAEPPSAVRRRRAAAVRVRRRRLLAIDLILALALALIVIVTAPGLAIVAIAALLVLLLCAAWLAYERLRQRRAVRRTRR